MAEYQLDVRQYRCPMPVLMVKQALSQLQSGDTLNITYHVESAVQDFQLLCDTLNCSLVQQTAHQLEITKQRK